MTKRLEIEVGHDTRQWTTFVVKNPTPEQEAVLTGDDTEAALALLAKLHDSGAAHADEWKTEDNPNYFAEAACPDIIDIHENEES